MIRNKLDINDAQHITISIQDGSVFRYVFSYKDCAIYKIDSSRYIVGRTIGLEAYSFLYGIIERCRKNQIEDKSSRRDRRITLLKFMLIYMNLYSNCDIGKYSRYIFDHDDIMNILNKIIGGRSSGLKSFQFPEKTIQLCFFVKRDYLLKNIT